MRTVSFFIAILVALSASGQSTSSQVKHVKENIKQSTTPTHTEYNKSFAVTNDSAQSHQTFNLPAIDTNYSDSTSLSKQDTIFKLDRRKIICSIKGISGLHIDYITFPDTILRKIERKHVQYIQYSDGRKEEFNRPVVEIIETNTWESILITDKADDVSGLYSLGEIEAISPPESINARAAKADATIRIKKQAAAMKGIIVHITKRESKGGYDEIPTYYMKGTVYTNKPPKKSEPDQSQQAQ